LNTTQGAKSGNPVSQSFITYPSTLYRASLEVLTEWFAFISCMQFGPDPATKQSNIMPQSLTL